MPAKVRDDPHERPNETLPLLLLLLLLLPLLLLLLLRCTATVKRLIKTRSQRPVWCLCLIADSIDCDMDLCFPSF